MPDVAWTDAERVAALFAVDPAGLGGVVVRARAGPERDAWLAALARLLPADRHGTAALHRLPLHVDDERLLGGLDLAATLQAGRVVAQRGLLAEADGGVVLLAMAERVTAGTAARIAAVLDTGERVAERDGLALREPSRIGVVALDEGIDDDEAVAPRLADRLAFRLEIGPAARAWATAMAAVATAGSKNPAAPEAVGGIDLGTAKAPVAATTASATATASAPAAGGRQPAVDPAAARRCEAVRAGRALLAQVTADDATVEALCAAALALGIDSVRAPLLALRAARASAALAGRLAVDARDAALAARLVLAWRATRLPPPVEAGDRAAGSPEGAAPVDPSDAALTDSGEGPSLAETPAAGPTVASTADVQATDAAPPSPEGGDSGPRSRGAAGTPPTPAGPVTVDDAGLDDIVLEAALASMPPHLLEALARLPIDGPRSPGSGGRAGAAVTHPLRGRPCGARRIEPRGGARLDLIQTLRAAAPWQALRRRQQPASSHRILIRREDFHVTRFKHRGETTTVFVVDASGSSALHRLAEAKGAVELLLADCYVRRDSVAVIAFRGRGAELLLPPTRSLVRAKRSLAGLPGGGGTPLAAGIEAAGALAGAVRRRGATAVVVLLTDGRANIALDGTPGRARATSDALAAARRLQAAGFAALLIDTSAQPQESARSLAAALGGAYLPLPHAAAPLLSRAVREASPTRPVAAARETPAR